MIIALPNGKTEVIFDERDFLNLLEEHMGYDARRWLEEYMEPGSDDADYIAYLEKELEAQKKRRLDAMKALRKQSEAIAELILEKEIDRVKLSHAAGAISLITWREINVS